MTARTVHDPFTGQDVQISDKLTDRLRGKYASGPTLPSGEPEFGWRQMPQIPIQVAAADRIESLEAAIRKAAAIIGANLNHQREKVWDAKAILDAALASQQARS